VTNDYYNVDLKIQSKDSFFRLLGNSNSDTKLVTFVNPFSYDVFLKYPELLPDFEALFVDGSLLVLMHNIFHKQKISRLSFDFTSIAGDVFSHCQDKNLSIAFIGATEDELPIALRNILSIHSKLNISYSRNGYFNDEIDYQKCIDDLKESKSDIVVIGMGSPLQEKFSIMLKHANTNISCVFTCGGFLTQTAISCEYYHPIIKKLGLRWLQRAVMHDFVRERLVKHYPVFVVKYLYNHFKLLFVKNN